MNTKKIMIMSLLILIVTIFCLTFKQSFSYVLNYRLIRNGTGSVGLKTANSTAITMSVQESNQGIMALSDEDGLAQEPYANITIASDVKDTFFRLELEYDINPLNNNYNSYISKPLTLYKQELSLAADQQNIIFTHSTSQVSNYTYYSNLVPEHFIKIAIFDKNGNLITQPTRLSSLPISQVQRSTDNTNVVDGVKYKFFEGTTTSTSPYTYLVKIWLDEEIMKYSCYNNSYLGFKISGYSSPSKSMISLRPGMLIGYGDTSSNFNSLKVNYIKNLVTGSIINNPTNSTEFRLSTSFYENETYSLLVNYEGKDIIVPFRVNYINGSPRVEKDRFNAYNSSRGLSPQVFAYTNAQVLDSLYTSFVENENTPIPIDDFLVDSTSLFTNQNIYSVDLVDNSVQGKNCTYLGLQAQSSFTPSQYSYTLYANRSGNIKGLRILLTDSNDPNEIGTVPVGILDYTSLTY